MNDKAPVLPCWYCGGRSPWPESNAATAAVTGEAYIGCKACDERREFRDMLDSAWAVIANAGGGDWELESAEWQGAAGEWRDKYFAQFNGRKQ